MARNGITKAEIAAARLMFEYITDKWHVQVRCNKSGLAIIDRIKCPKSIKAGAWEADRSPAEWVGLQRDSKKYIPVH